MGSGGSKEVDSSTHSESAEGVGSQLYVSLKMQVERGKRLGDLVPHVYGSAHLVGSWDPAKAVSPH